MTKKKPDRPIGGMFRKMIDQETGEVCLAIRAMHPIDRRLMRERGFKAGDEVRLTIKWWHNVKFFRLMHGVGNLLVDSVEKFAGRKGHDALKEVQRESGVCCDLMEFDLGPLGKFPVNQARSMAFDEMTPDEFDELFNGVCDYIDQHYQSVMTEELRAEYLLMTAGNERRAA